MVKKCCVPNCNSGYPTCEEKYSMFFVPEEKLVAWNHAIPRKDRNLTTKDCVCEKHFTKEQIIRELRNECYLIPLKRPRLDKDAIPSIFPNCPKYFNKKPVHKRRIIQKVDYIPSKKRKSSIDDTDGIRSNNCENVTLTFKIDKDNEYPTQTPLFTQLLWEGKLNKIELPSSQWNVNNVGDDSLSFIAFTCMTILGRNIVTEKKIVIDQQMNAQCYIFENLLTDVTKQFASVDEINKFLTEFDDTPVCRGTVRDEANAVESKTYYQDPYTHSWRHKDCQFRTSQSQSSKNLCHLCQRLKYIIQKSKTKVTLTAKLLIIKKKIKTQQQYNRRLQKRFNYLKSQLKEAQNKFQEVVESDLLSTLDS